MKTLITILMLSASIAYSQQQPILVGTFPFKIEFCKHNGGSESFYNVNMHTLKRYGNLVQQGAVIPELNFVGGPEITIFDFAQVLMMSPSYEFDAPNYTHLTWNEGFQLYVSTFGSVSNLGSCGGQSYFPMVYGYSDNGLWHKLWTVSYPSDPTGESGNNFTIYYLD